MGPGRRLGSAQDAGDVVVGVDNLADEIWTRPAVIRLFLRPPFAHDAFRTLPGGRVRVDFKAAWRSG